MVFLSDPIHFHWSHLRLQADHPIEIFSSSENDEERKPTFRYDDNLYNGCDIQ